jgi:hypothetical protein
MGLSGLSLRGNRFAALFLLVTFLKTCCLYNCSA